MGTESRDKPPAIEPDSQVEAGPNAGATDWIGEWEAQQVGPPEDPRSQALAARARQLLSADDAVVLTAPELVPDWLDPAWLEGRKATNDTPTAYLCRGQTCSLPAHTPEELELPRRT